MTFSLNTDSFIFAVRQLIAKRGDIRSIYSDNGSYFIGAERELKKDLEEMNGEKIKSFMQENGGDWNKWYGRPPIASHMRCVWEIYIRSHRAIFSSLLKTHRASLDYESLITFMAEVDGVLNSEPLTFKIIEIKGYFTTRR